MLTQPFALAQRTIDRISLDGLLVSAVIGVHAHEKTEPQPLRISVDLQAERGVMPAPTENELADFVLSLIDGGHLNLVETLADKIADQLLAGDRTVSVRVRIEKPAAIAEPAGVGVEIEKFSAW